MVVNVGGIGLRVYTSAGVLAQLDGAGQPVELFTHLHVRENELSLYGFLTEEKLALFKLLLSISGIGPKVASALLGAVSPDALRQAVVQNEPGLLSRVPGVGSKTAKKIIFHLKDKIIPTGMEAAPSLSDTDAEVIAALTGLGFRPEVPINISGYVAPRIAVVPEVLVVPNRLRVPMRRLLQIRYRVGEKPFRITGITVSDPEIKTEISEPTAKAPKNVGGFEVIRIVVTLPARDKPLTDVETITITTDDEDYRELVVLLRPGKVPAAQPAGPQTPEVGPADQPDP